MVVSDPKYDIPRDFEGYGEQSLDPKWPNNAKLAVSFILNYEEGGERCMASGDGQSEPYLWEKGASSSFVTGARHMAAESEYEYGSRSGSWRILRLFKEMGYHFTTWAVSQALTANPTFARAMVRDGHEIAAHGARWLDIFDYTLEEEKKYIRKNCEELEAVTGVFPRGYFFGRGTPNTRALWPEVVAEMGKERGDGKKLLYSSEAFNDDVPYWLDLPAEKDLPDSEKEGLLVVPYNYDCNDGKFHMSPGFVGSQMYLDYLKSTFDMLLREGRSGSPKLMNIPLHTRIIGKPGRSEALRNFMLYIKEQAAFEGEIWVTTRQEIAEHFKGVYPYDPGHLAPGKTVGL